MGSVLIILFVAHIIFIFNRSLILCLISIRAIMIFDVKSMSGLKANCKFIHFRFEHATHEFVLLSGRSRRINFVTLYMNHSYDVVTVCTSDCWIYTICFFYLLTHRSDNFPCFGMHCLIHNNNNFIIYTFTFSQSQIVYLCKFAPTSFLYRVQITNITCCVCEQWSMLSTSFDLVSFNKLWSNMNSDVLLKH